VRVVAASLGVQQVGDVSPLSSLARCAPRGSRRAAAVVAAALVVLVTAGCSLLTPSGPAPSPGPDRTAPVGTNAAGDPAVDYHDAEAVCDAFSSALLTVDTTSDRSPGDALARAARYATAGLLAAAPPAGVDARWQEWTGHQAHTRVTTSAYAGDAGGPDERPRAVRLARVTPVGRDGWQGPVSRYAVHCALEAHGDGALRVTGYELEPLGQ